MRVVGTGVELRPAEEPLAWVNATPEQRADSERVARGEMLEVRAVLFAEVETDGQVFRAEQSSLARRIDVTADPTSALIRLARDAREEDDLMGDVARDEDLTRFEYHAAPHRIELSPELRERLGGAAWSERAPRE